MPLNKAIVVLTFIYTVFMSSIMSSVTAASSSSSSLAIATRLHLGQSSQPPPTSQLHKTLSSFAQVASNIGATHAVVAVDSEEKLEGYDLLEEVTKICQSLNDNTSDNDKSSEMCTSSSHTTTTIHVLPVTPWGKFVPALNAIVTWCANHKCQYLLFASAEVQLTQDVLNVLISKMDIERTLVVGTVLSGHEYKQPMEDEEEIEVELTGRTTPWNTCALWNVPKLAFIGFLLVSEGLHPEEEEGISSAGVEEVVAIATLQRILQPCNAQAKLVSIPGTSWGTQDFNNDEKRKEWHEKKMMSKLTRAKRQLDLLGLSGTVIHC